MEGMKQAFGMIGRINKTFIIQYPSGRFGYVGSIPDCLCKELIGGSYASGKLTSMVFETRQEAIDFAKLKNIEIK